MQRLSILFVIVFCLVSCSDNKLKEGKPQTETADTLVTIVDTRTKTVQEESDSIIPEKMPAVKKKPQSPVVKELKPRKVIIEEKPEPEDLSVVVDTVGMMPQFPGGDSELKKFIESNLKYPVVAQENGIQGRVVVRFTVKKDGTVNDPHIVRGLDPSCDKEALRVVSRMPRWLPAKQNGRAVEVRHTLPVIFKLKY